MKNQSKVFAVKHRARMYMQHVQIYICTKLIQKGDVVIMILSGAGADNGVSNSLPVFHEAANLCGWSPQPGY